MNAHLESLWRWIRPELLHDNRDLAWLAAGVSYVDLFIGITTLLEPAKSFSAPAYQPGLRIFFFVDTYTSQLIWGGIFTYIAVCSLLAVHLNRWNFMVVSGVVGVGAWLVWAFTFFTAWVEYDVVAPWGTAFFVFFALCHFRVLMGARRVTVLDVEG